MARVASKKLQNNPTTNLGHVLKRWRLIDDLGMREAGRMLGISAATLLRLEMGHKADQDTWLKILNWFAARSDSQTKESESGGAVES